MLQLDMQQILSQAICFVILWLVLKKLAWRPLLELLDQRREKIQADLKHAEQTKAEMLQLQAQLEERLSHIDEESRVSIQQAVKEGKRIASEIQEDARKQSQDLLVRSKETVALELAKAKVTLRDQVADMTVEAVEKVLHKKLDAEDDSRLVERVLDELEQPDESK